MQCQICPNKCLVTSFCGAPKKLKINTYQLHYGEEPVLVGGLASGTIFFAHCNMRCCFCQNYKISQLGSGYEIDEEKFLEIVLELKHKNAVNINLVSPTPYSALLIPVLKRLKKSGFDLPIIWNSNGYEDVEILKRLEGLVDIYLPDFKYWDNEIAFKYSEVKNYRENAQSSIAEMYRQTGNLIVDEDELAYFGLMVRLLVLPNNLSQTDKIIEWLNDEFGNKLYISLMSQYYPAYNATLFPELNRGITNKEYQIAVQKMTDLCFENGFIQQPATTPEWTPDFT